MIQIKNLEFKYATADRPLLRVKEFLVARGEKVFLQGESGSGKSTLLSLLTGILSADAGEVRVLGEDFTQISAAQRDQVRGDRMGYIFQQFNLIPYLTTEQNIALPCRLHAHRMARLEDKNLASEVHRLAKALAIEDLLHRPVTDLSVGQQQRVAAARALIGNPEIIIADEPTSSLDYNRRERFIELLMKECALEKSALLFVSHDPTLAPLFDRTVNMHEINSASAGGSK